MFLLGDVLNCNFKIILDAADGVETISRTCELGGVTVSAANLDIIRFPGINMGLGISAIPTFLTAFSCSLIAAWMDSAYARILVASGRKGQ